MAVGCVLKENGEKGMTCLLIQLTGELLSYVPSILYCGDGRHSRRMNFWQQGLFFLLILYAGAVLRVILFLRWTL